MRMDKMLETLLSLGLVVGAGYVVVKYVIPMLTKTNKEQNVVDGSSCAGGTCDTDENALTKLMRKFEELLDDDSDEGAAVLVSEAQKEGISTAGIGGLLTNATKPVTATSLFLQKTTAPTRTNQPYGSLVNVSGPAGKTLTTTWIL